MGSDERLIKYIVDMIGRSSEYGLSEKDFYGAAEELRRAKEGKIDAFGDTRELIIDTLEETRVFDTVCDKCNEWKFHDQQEDIYYCPVCNGGER